MARTSKYTREVLAEAVAASASIAGVLRHLGVPLSGGMHAHISRRIKFFDLDTRHFTGQGHNRGLLSRDRQTAEQILVVRMPGSGRAKPRMLRRALIESGVPYQCAACGVGGTWNGMPLILHVDHIDGNYLDCQPSNVRFLCPNCHSQTPSWAGGNKLVRHYRMPPALGYPIRVDQVLTLFDRLDEQSAS
jgi:5-methylcytosine-specific restriction endonuclease McrA